MIAEQYPWCDVEWLLRPDITNTKHLLLVRAIMPGGKAHLFHRHPLTEEAIYILEGTAHQWVGEECRLLGPGDVAHIPRDLPHATYNASASAPLRFLAILSPVPEGGENLIDVSQELRWNRLGESTPALRD